MNYRVRREGVDLGVLSLDELRRRCQTGELTGNEYVQGEGASDWQPLNMVLQRGYQTTPPPLPMSASRSGPSQILVWTAIVGGVILLIGLMVVFVLMANKAQQGYLSVINRTRPVSDLSQPNPKAVAAASEPILWTTNSQTVAEVQKRARQFRIRQWMDGYEKRGRRNPECDAEADRFIQTYIDSNYGGPKATNSAFLEGESDKLDNDPSCTDPLVLTVAADESLNLYDSIRRFDRALAAYPESLHKAYPRFYATVRLTGELEKGSDRIGALDTSALQLLPKCFADGSFTPADQQEIANIFADGWGTSYFERNAESVCAIAHEAGPDYEWLALTLDGEREINEAWAARGDGYANSVTTEGWQGFHTHLAQARTDLTGAWNLQPGYPLAPRLMMTVSLGDSGIQEMRLWFNRTTLAQVDEPGAWTEMRWGLRPRWYGNEQAMLALGVAAVRTGRFDTDAPRKYMDCINDVESEMELPAGRHIYGRSDIWPDLKRMYDGYVSSPAQAQARDGWRTSYAIVAYFAGKYDVARTQLEALNWKPPAQSLSDWSVDLSLMPLEVAARTGPLGRQISDAEIARDADDIDGALKKYSDLKDAAGADARTGEFIQRRLSQLTAEQRLQKGEWISLLPSRDNDPDWVYSFGNARVLPDGALEVESGPKGHMLFSRVRAGMDFEVRGQFELVRSSNKNFQGGLVMGVPDYDGYNWYGFRIKRHDEEGDVVCFGRGWSRQRINQHLVMNDVTNSFDFIFQDGKVTASVNGVQMFNQAAPPVTMSVPDNSYLVGLGAFNDSADTVIRYRGVQLRKL